jgi:hypothetical protein
LKRSSARALRGVNEELVMQIVRQLGLAAVAITAWCAAPAHAADVHWSIGIHAPIGPGVALGTVISDRRYAPVWVPPPPVVYPAPVVYAPPPVVYAPPRVVYAPAPVAYAPVWVGGRWVHRHHHRHGWHGHHDRGWRDDHRGPPHFVPRRPGREIRY